MKYMSAFILLLLSVQTQADEYISFNLFSEHRSPCNRLECPQYNEQNYGLGYHTDEWITGFYENSFNETSIYIGKRFSNEHNIVSMNIGLVSGYKGHDEVKAWEVGDYHIFAFPSVHLGKPHRLTMTWMYNATSFNFEYKFR